MRNVGNREENEGNRGDIGGWEQEWGGLGRGKLKWYAAEAPPC